MTKKGLNQCWAAAFLALLWMSNLSATNHLDSSELGVDTSFKQTSLTPYIKLLRDPGASLTIDDVQLTQQMARFDGNGSNQLKLGFSDDTIWGLMLINNESSAPIQLWLQSNYPLLDYFHLYVEDANGVFTATKMGDLYPFSQRGQAHRKMMTKITLAANKTTRVFFKIRSQSSLQIDLSLLSPDALAAETYHQQLLLGFYYGLISVMLIYNFLMFVSLRERQYGYYSLYILSYLFFQSALNGLSFQYLWPNRVMWNNQSVPLFLCLAAISLTLFFRHYVQFEQHFPKLDRLLQQITLVFAANIILMPLTSYAFAIQVATVTALVFAVSIFSCGLYAWNNQIDWAKYFVLAFGLQLIGVIMYVFKTLGWLPTVFITEYAIQIGSALQIIWLSVGVAIRIKQLNREKAAIKVAATQQLERKVADKTQALQQTMKKLLADNEALHNQTIIDELTQVYNRRYFDNRIYEEWSHAYREQQPVALIVVDIDHFKQFNDKYGHELGDKCLHHVAQLIKQSVQRATDAIARYGGEEFTLILPNTDGNGAALVAETLRKAVEDQPFEYQDFTLAVTVSAGVASMLPSEQNSMIQLFRSADQAMFQAKKMGRNQIMLGETVLVAAHSSSRVGKA